MDNLERFQAKINAVMQYQIIHDFSIRNDCYRMHLPLLPNNVFWNHQFVISTHSAIDIRINVQ